MVVREGSAGAINNHLARERGGVPTFDTLGLDGTLTGNPREMRAAAAEFGERYADRWLEVRTARIEEARELYARLDELTKAEASHLISLIG